MSIKVSHLAFALAFALPASFAFAAPQSHGHGGGHDSSMPAMNHDAHGDAVSNTAAQARADDMNVGKTVSPVANDKNKGKHEAKGHAKTHHHSHKH